MAIRIITTQLLLMIVLLFCVSHTIAQTATDGSDENIILEEIIVTANKRTESVQNVGLSVRAILGSELQDRGITDFEGFAVTIPNLSFGATDDGVLANRTISIRGIQGLNTTSLYLDDIPLDESLSPLVLDVERIEVLRGPQGTLYGARGLGGTVKIVTKKPEFDEVFGYINGNLSSVQEGGLNYTVDGGVNIPLADNAGLRLSAYHQTESGIFDKIIGSATAPGVGAPAGTAGAIMGSSPTRLENVDEKTTYGAQIALLAELGDSITLESKILLQNTQLSGFPLADQIYTNSGNLLLNGDDYTQERLFNFNEGADDEWLQFSLNLNFELTGGNLTYSGGYFTRETNDFEDSSEFISFTLLGVILPNASVPSSPTALLSPIYQKLEFDSQVHELRFISDFNGSNHFIGGLFYQNTDDNEAFTPRNVVPGLNQAFSGFVGAPHPPGALPGGDLVFTSNSPAEIEEIGAYGEFTRDFGERFSATIGVRFFDTTVTTEDYFNGFAVGSVPSTARGTQREDGANAKLLAEYKASDSLFLYGTISEGFRIGGNNGPLPAALGCPANATQLGLNVSELAQYRADSLLSMELGAKSTLLDGRVTVNGALFQNDIDNIQQRVLLTCGFDFIANLGAAKTSGIEMEAVARLTPSLLFQAGIGYTKAEFTRTVRGIVNAGDPLQQVPELTYNINLDYNAPSFINDFEWLARLDYSFVDKSVSTVVNANSARQRPAFSLLNLRVGLHSDLYKIELFIDNATDETAVYSDNRTLAAEAAGRARIVRNRPRTMGLAFKRYF